MERLTKRSVTGPSRYVSAIGSGHGAWPRIIQRLAAYEDTGLEPEEVATMQENGLWIPVAEQLPKTDGRFMVTIKGRSGKPHVEMRNFHAGSQKWENQCGWLSDENILAWQARPRPYGWKPREKA